MVACGMEKIADRLRRTRMTNGADGKDTAGFAGSSPRLAALSVAEGMEVRSPLLLPTLLPCCAQLALPYMAKVIGGIGNHFKDEVLEKITVVLLNEEGDPIGETSDLIALDQGEWGEFEVRIPEIGDGVRGYRINVERTDESDPWFG
jgi:hypothetical protein